MSGISTIVGYLPVVASAGTAGLCACSDAVVNKLAHRNFANLVGLTTALVGDNATARQFVLAMTAGCLLAAVLCVLRGAITTVRGDRGGVETMLGGAYGLLAIVAVFGVVL